MGSYASLTIGDLELYWTKNDVDPAVMMLYTDQDKRVIPRSHIAESNSEDGNSDETPECEVKYVTTLAVAKDRLEFMGFTLGIVKQAFEEGLIGREMNSTKGDPIHGSQTPRKSNKYSLKKNKF